MNDIYTDDFIELVRLGLPPEEQIKYNNNKADYNKAIGKTLNEARKRAKQPTCYVCGKETTSFCNSHSVPQFCLKTIAIDGKVFMSGIQDSIPYLGTDTGVKSAGAFQIICRECDNMIFQEYENPLSYDKEPTGQMLAQIAMKNYLQMIFKRNMERELCFLWENDFPYKIDATGLREIKAIDLDEYVAGYNRARIASSGHHDNWYYLCYYVKLDYTVPLAFQGQIALVCDFEGNVINDIYNSAKEYKTQDIHIAVFPFEDKSVVFAFIDSRNKRYRNFYKKLKKLDLNEQLATINYVIFKYSENVFLSKKIPDSVFKNQYFIDVCRSTSIANVAMPFLDPLQIAMEDYSLSNRNNIPNLLSKEYAII